MSPKGSQKTLSAYGLIPVCRGVYIHYFKINPPKWAHLLLSPLFWKLSQSLGQDKQHSKQTYCQLSIIIFLWTPKSFISPESFLNFLLNLYIPPRLRKSFKFIVLRLLQIHLWVKKLNLFNFIHAPKQNSPPGFYHYPPGKRELPIHPEQHFVKIFFPE